jgi:predicted  nucleic acid-binding Zn-ribbon protein
MGTKCTACNEVISGEAVHMPKVCPHCGNTDRTKFIRVDEEDSDPTYQEKHLEAKGYLESRREE